MTGVRHVEGFVIVLHNFSKNLPSLALLMRGRPTSLGLAWTQARTESSVRILNLDTNKYYLLPLSYPSPSHSCLEDALVTVAVTVSGVTTHRLTDIDIRDIGDAAGVT